MSRPPLEATAPSTLPDPRVQPASTPEGPAPAEGQSMAVQTLNTVTRAVGLGSFGFGALASVTPSALRRAYGDTTDGGGSLDYFARTWGTRTAMLGALTLMASSDTERKRITTLACAVNVVDSLAAFRATGMPTRTRTLAALTSAAFAVATGYVAANV